MIIRKLEMRELVSKSKAFLRDSFVGGLANIRKQVNKPVVNNRLLIYDNIFPQKYSAFRIAEFNAYLEYFQNAYVYSTASAFKMVGETRSFKQVVDDYESQYPSFRDRTFKYSMLQDTNNALVYTVFVNNAARFINIAEIHRTPFVFTLYPGGGFGLNNPISDGRLKRIFSSSSFQKVIVTQKITYDYLCNNNFCPTEKIEFIYGGVNPPRQSSDGLGEKLYFGKNKETFDICFVANKYTERGVDKGYDIFIQTAKDLASISKLFNFHVVGPFSGNDIPLGGITDRVHFYGYQDSGFFSEFYNKMDIVLSPNRPFILAQGAFDGFPTGACVEAGLAGVAVFCTDPLEQNYSYRDLEDIVIVNTEADEISEKILFYFNNPQRLETLGITGRQTFQKLFSLEAQMAPRIRLLSSFMPEQN